MLILTGSYHPLRGMLVCVMTSMTATDVLLEGTATSLPTSPVPLAFVTNELLLCVLLVELGDVQIDQALAIDRTTACSTLR